MQKGSKVLSNTELDRTFSHSFPSVSTNTVGMDQRIISLKIVTAFWYWCWYSLSIFDATKSTFTSLLRVQPGIQPPLIQDCIENCSISIIIAYTVMDSLWFHPQNTLTIKSFNITQIALNIYILTANIFVLTQFLQQNARVIIMVYYHLLLYYAVGNKSKLVVLTAAGCFGVLNVFRGALTFVGHLILWGT